MLIGALQHRIRNEVLRNTLIVEEFLVNNFHFRQGEATVKSFNLWFTMHVVTWGVFGLVRIVAMAKFFVTFLIIQVIKKTYEMSKIIDVKLFLVFVLFDSCFGAFQSITSAPLILLVCLVWLPGILYIWGKGWFDGLLSALQLGLLITHWSCWANKNIVHVSIRECSSALLEGSWYRQQFHWKHVNWDPFREICVEYHRHWPVIWVMWDTLKLMNLLVFQYSNRGLKMHICNQHSSRDTCGCSKFVSECPTIDITNPRVCISSMKGWLFA